MELARKQSVPLGASVALMDERERVWANAHPIAGRDPSIWRRDDDCRTMRFADFGDRNSSFGWEIEVSPFEDGQDENLRAVHWESHAARNGGDLLSDRDFARSLAPPAQ